jgi:hypothetical protein
MIKPTTYKSISTTQLLAKEGDSIDSTKKLKAITILQKLSQLIKLKHS